MIYLDNSATTPLTRPVLEAMWPYMTDVFANASSHHEMGRLAAHGLESARRDVAAVLNCRPAEIIFTSGGTEANNFALKGLALANPKGKHLLTSAVEHKAVLEACQSLVDNFGFELDVIEVDQYGMVNVDALAQALRPDTTLCSIMYANNEVGTVQPIAEIGRLCSEQNVMFHTDAVQAAAFLDIDVAELGVSAMSVSAHKFNGPKGVGVLYLRSGSAVVPLIDGGGQERGRRSGTSNVAGAVGLAQALTIAAAQRGDNVARLTAQRNTLIEGVLQSVPQAVLTGHPTARLPHHASFCFNGVGGETVLQELEQRGVCCSSGSACAAGSDDVSHVLTAMGIDEATARSAVRLTLGIVTAEEEVSEVLRLVPLAVAAVSSLSN